MIRRIGQFLLFCIPLIFLAIFFFYPLARILQRSLFNDGQLDLVTVFDTLTAPFVWRVLWFTIWQAALSTLLTLALGLPLAYLFSHFDFPGKTIIKALITVPFVMPTVVVAAAFTAVAGANGLLNQWLEAALSLDEPPLQIMRSVWGILLAHVFYNVSVIVRTVGSFWANLNPRVSEAAQVLGANRVQLLMQVTLPLLLPSIVAAALLVFLFCFTSFGVVLILGGLRFATLEVEIYRQAVSLFNLPAAATLSLLQIVITFAIMAVYTRLQARAARPLQFNPQTRVAQPPRTVRTWIFLAGALLAATLLLLSPLLALAWRSVTLGDAGFTLQYFAELTENRRNSAFFVAPIVAVRNSLIYALLTMCLSLVLGILSAYLLVQIPATRRGGALRLPTGKGKGAPVRGTDSSRRHQRSWRMAILDPLFLLPLGTSAVTLGFGYIIAMGSLRTSPLLVPVAHTLIATPFVVRTFLPALRSLDPKLRESAAVMGATPTRVWLEVDLPLLFRAALVGAVFAFTISLGEFGASLLVTRPDLPTMPVVIFRALGEPGLLNYGQALAMSTILMVVSALGLIVIERFRIGEVGEF